MVFCSCCKERRPDVQGKLPLTQRAAYGVGHILNDLTSSVSFIYIIIYLTSVAGLSNRNAGLVVLFGQISDAISNGVTGVLSDRTVIRYGRRKIWHIVGTAIVTIAFPLLMTSRVLEPGSSDALKFGYYTVMLICFQTGWGCVQVNHLSLIPDISRPGKDRIELNVIRTAMTFLSNIYVFAVTWILLGQSSERNITPNVWKEFMYLSFIIIATGSLCNIVFHVVIKEPHSARYQQKQIKRAEKHKKFTEQESKEDGGFLLNPVETSSPNHLTTGIPCETTVDHALVSGHEDLPKRQRTKLDWLKHPAFIKTALLYICSRLIIRISQTYLALYLTETMEFGKEAIAYFPLVVLISCTLASISVKPLTKRLGNKITYLLGTVLTIGASVWFFLQTADKRNAVYAATVLIGSGSSMMLVTSLSYIADLIGEDTTSGAFVYGVITSSYKLFSGVIIAIVQELNPKQHYEENCTECNEYVRLIYSIVPGIIAVIGLLTVMICTESTFTCKPKAECVEIQVISDGEQSSEKSHQNVETTPKTDLSGTS